uniref:ATP-dependent DNA helicase n=1 Tax=Tanacetum cinerariifolium TaxID=118510 RepID=A0A6L2MGV5_TANCI|nr:DNA helicase [Tanacetum cinerariifolium]
MLGFDLFWLGVIVGEETSHYPVGRIRRSSKQKVENSNFEEHLPLIATITDNRTMAEMLRAPTEGCVEAIVVPPILAEQFELKHSLINMMTSEQFFGLEKDNPHDHIRWFNKITSTIKYKDVPNSVIKLILFPFSLAGAARWWLEKEPSHFITTWDDLVLKFINEFFPPHELRTSVMKSRIFNKNSMNLLQKFDESFHEAWERYKDLLCACPHYGFTKLHQLDTFYNALNPPDQDSLNAAAGGNLLEKSPQDALTIIENKSMVCNSRSKPIASPVKAYDINSSSEIAKLTHAVNQQTSDVTTTMTAMLKQLQENPHPAQVKAVEEICVTCGGAHPYYQCLARTYRRCQEQPYQAIAQSNQNFHFNELEKIKRMNDVSMKAMQNQIDMVKNELRNEMKTFIQNFLSNQTNEIKNMMARLLQMNTASTSGSGSFPSNTIANPKGELKAITTRSGLVTDGHTVPTPTKSVTPEEDECQEKDETQIQKFWHMFKQLHLNITLAEALVLMPKYQKMLKALLSNKEKLQDLANTPLNENCSAVIFKKLPKKLENPRKFLIPCGFSELKCKALADLGASINLMPLSVWKKLADFVVVDYESDPRVSLILGRPFLRTARALIDVHGKEMILRDGVERLTLNMKHDTASYSNHPHRKSANLINIFNVSSEDCLKDSVSNQQSGNPTFSFHKEITSPKVAHDIHDSEGCNFLSEELPDIDSFNDIHLYFDDNPLSKDSSLKDSINQTDLANLDNYFVDPTPEMFNDEHAPDYSFPLRFDMYDDDFLEIESDADNFYDDPFDSKGEKIKESKLLIDELDLLCDFLPYSEYDSFASQDFSKDDDFPSPNNEDKVFNLRILIHEKSVTIITRVAQEKKLATSYASLVFEDFDPPFYEPLVFKDVPKSMMLLLFSSENEEKVFKPGIYTFEKVHSCFLLELSHPGYHVFKVNQIFISLMSIFHVQSGKNTHLLDVLLFHFYPPLSAQIFLNFENPKAHVSSVSDNLIRTSAISDPGQFGTYATHQLDSDSVHQLHCIPTAANLVSDIATGMSHIVMDDQCKKHVGHDGALISSDKCSFWNVEKEAQLNHYPSVLAANGLSTVPKVASDIGLTPSTVSRKNPRNGECSYKKVHTKQETNRVCSPLLFENVSRITANLETNKGNMSSNVSNRKQKFYNESDFAERKNQMLGIPFSDRNKGSREISQISCQRGENGQPGRIHRRNTCRRSHTMCPLTDLNFIVWTASVMHHKIHHHPLLDPNATSICSNVEDMDSQYSKHSDEERISSELSNYKLGVSRAQVNFPLREFVPNKKTTMFVHHYCLKMSPVLLQISRQTKKNRRPDELDCLYNNQNAAQGLSSMYIDIDVRYDFIWGTYRSVNNRRGPYVFKIFRAARDKCDGQSIPDFKIRLFVVASAREYDLLTSDTLGAIVFESGPDTRMNYDVIIEPKDGFPQRINRLHKSYMSLQFPLLFVHGQSGYYPKMKQRDDDDKRISMNNYYMYQLHERSGLYGLLFKGGGDRVGSDIGGKFILLRTFTSGPRYMYSHYLDAFAICRVLGNPQFFFTFTCNVNWPEIKRRMEHFPGLTLADRAYVVVRVFEQKVHDFCDFLQHSRHFGIVTGYLYTIEFQERGLPHCHTLLWAKHPSVQILSVHEENMQPLTFRDSQSLASIVDDDKKKKNHTYRVVTYNKHHTDGRHLSYIPKYYVWYPQQKIWSPRQRKGEGSIGRLVYVHHASEEFFYLQMIIFHQQGCKTFKDIRTVNKVIYDTYRAACEALGLLGDDKEWHTALKEAAFSSTPTELRNLFVQILIFCEVAALKRLWDTYWRKMSDDIPKIISETHRILNLHINDPELQAKVLYKLEVILKGQRRIYSTAKEQQELIFVYGHGGTGKTFLWKVLISAVRSEGKIVLDVASSRIASLLLPAGTPDANDSDSTSWISIPEEYCLPNTKDGVSKLIDVIYDKQTLEKTNALQLQQKAIACLKNNTADMINSAILSVVAGESSIYKSSDEALSIGNDGREVKLLYPTEYLNSVQISGFPSHEIELKVGAQIMLLRNMNIQGGLFNGTRIIVKKLWSRLVEAQIITGNRVGEKVYIPKIIFVGI